MAVDNLGISLLNSAATNSLYGRNETKESSTELTMNDFYQLLATQLKYQDADNPMDTSQMMVQMVQTQMITALEKMTTTINDLALVNTTSYAASMIGKEVTVAKLGLDGNYNGETVTGTVTSVNLGTPPTLVVDGETYYLAQLMEVGTKGDQKAEQPADKQEEPKVPEAAE